MVNISKIQKEQYNELGFIRIESFFSLDELKELENNLALYIKEVTPILKDDEINYTKSGEINSIHRLANYQTSSGDYFKNLLDLSKIKDLASAFLDDEPEGRKVEYFAKPAKHGMASPWHQDNFYWCVTDHRALTLWLSLDSASPENGAVKYIPKSHRLGLLDHKPSYVPGSSQIIADHEMIEKLANESITPNLKPGDCLLHHSLAIHSSDPNNSNQSRRGITFQYKAKNSTYDQERLKSYLESLKLQVSLRQEV